MPYIKSDNDRRKKLQIGHVAQNAGELNFQIFYYIKHNAQLAEEVKYEQFKIYVDNFLGNSPNYQRFNDMTGALVRCHREIQRRLGINEMILLDVLNSYDKQIEIYENLKISENGDVI